MHKKDEKKIFWGYTPYDYRASEALFSRMSEQGWMIQSVTPYIAVFRADKPKKRIFRAAIYDRSDISDRSRAHYIDQWKKAGMQHACDFDQYYWFYSEKESIPVEEGFFSKESRLISSAVWRKELYSVILMLLAIGFGAIKLYNVSYVSFITYSEFIKLCLLPFFFPICAAIYIYAGIWMAKCRHIFRKGGCLPVPSRSAANFRRALVFVPVMVFFLSLLLALALDACTGYSRTVILVSPLLLVLCIAWIIRALKRRGQAAVIGRVLIIMAMLVCIVVYAVGNYRSFSSGLPEDSDVAVLADLRKDYVVKNTTYIHTASPAVALHYVYKETAQDGSTANTEFFRCRTDGFADLIYKYIDRALEGVDAKYTLSRDGKTIVYKEYKIKE